MKKYILITLLLIMFYAEAQQQKDSLMLQSIYRTALLDGKAYDWLDYLTNQIGGRLSGSLNAERAVEWSKEELEKLSLNKVWLQPVLVPKWVRGPKEFALIETEPGVTFNVPITALGGSVATPSVGLKAEGVEVQNFEELAALGREKIDGKIVFFQSPHASRFDQHILCLWGLCQSTLRWCSRGQSIWRYWGDCAFDEPSHG